MECPEGGLVNPEDLVAYISGEADSPTASHIKACSACGKEAAAYAETARTLSSKLFRIDCPPAQTLGELALELLDPEVALQVRAHLVHCPHCHDELTNLSTALRDDPLADASRGRNWLQRVAAMLVPAAPSPTAAAVRGVDRGADLTYRVTNITISLTVESGELTETWNLLGAVVDETGETELGGAPVRVLRREVAVSETMLDEWGLFAFSALEPGVYTVEIDLPNHPIAVKQIDIGERGSELGG